MFIVFISKFFALFPLIIDDFLRFIRIIINLFTDSSSVKPFYSVSRLNFLRNTSIVIASSFFFTMLGGIIFVEDDNGCIENETITLNEPD